MDFETKISLLIEKIQTVLKAGVLLNESVLHYIDSTFLNPTIQELSQILIDEDNPEREPLLELIFFPNQAIQIELEDILEQNQFDQQAKENVIDFFRENEPYAMLCFPDKKDTIKLKVPYHCIKQFILRLHIDRVIDTQIIETLDQWVEPKDHNKIKVKLRNKKGNLNYDQLFFLCSFLEKIRSDTNDFEESLDFAIEFIYSVKENSDIYNELIKRKRVYFQSIQKAKKLEKQLQNKNMEMLILQGVRFLSIDQDKAFRKMEIIDRISRAIFGKTEFFNTVHQTTDLGNFQDNDDLNNMIKALT